MIRFPILAGAMLALIALPATAEDRANLTTGAISQEGLPQISKETAGANLPVDLQGLSNHSVTAQ